MVAGAVTPTYAILLGRIVEMFDPMLSADQRHDKMMDFIPWVIVIALGTYLSNWLGYSLMQISAERLSFKLRARYLDSLMRQEITYFEKQDI